MNIPEYLKSEQARADVAALLAKTPDIDGGRGRWHSISAPLASLTAMPDRVWTRVDILFAEIDATSPARAYFRPEADRFMVTDLGEAVHAQRLRTGRMRTDDDCEECYQDSEVIFHRCALHARVDQVSLSAAICRVMFAAYEVARL